MADDLREWLERIGLTEYLGPFVENAINFELLPHLSNDDLKELGISKLGDRKTLLLAIEQLGADRKTETPEKNASPTSSENYVGVERRQLTVMFCDLVGSTALSQQFDPEDLRDLMRRYHDTVAHAVARYEGHVAQLLGDGVLAYFGWPRAYEDQSERAIRAGLDAVAAVDALDVGAPMRARVGIATGQVVVGDLMGEAVSDTQAVTGDTPNLAARLQGIAAPGQVVISAATRLLVGRTFELTDLGRHELKGFSNAIPVWSVRGEGIVESRFEASRVGVLTRLVGREHELDLLRARWEMAKKGEGQVVLLSGEAGIGKSRLTRALMESVAGDRHTRIRYQCSPHHLHSALYPFITQLERAAGFQAGDSADVRRAKLADLLRRGTNDIDEALPLVASLLSVPLDTDIAAHNADPQRQKQRTLQLLVDQLVGLSDRDPVLMIFEDAHWIDPTSRELLDRTVPEIGGAPVLILITHRPEYRIEWSQHPHVTALTLNRLGRDKGLEMVNAAGGRGLPYDVARGIVERTDGVPLFVEELTRSVLETGAFSAQTDIPATLQDSLIARLDRLGSAKEIAQFGAVIGRDFPFRLLSTVAGRPEKELGEALDILVGSGLVFQRGMPPESMYTFKHALVQDSAYESVLRRQRRELHGRVASAIVDSDPEATATRPELIAYHLTEAGERQEALRYWRQAAALARERSAHTEAVAHVEQALALIDSLPEGSQRQETELALRRDLGSSMMLTKGFASDAVGQAHARYFELCETYGAEDQFAFALHGLYHYHYVRAEPAQVHSYGRRFLALAKEAGDDYFLAQAHLAIGGASLMEGRFPEAREYLERTLAIYARGDHGRYTRDWGYDLSIFGRGFLAHTLWHLGFPDQARAVSREAMAAAEAINHPFGCAVALAYEVMLHQLCRMPEHLLEVVGDLEQVCDEYGFAYYKAWAGIMRGWAEAATGRNAEALDNMRAALDDLQATGARTRCSLHHSLIAELLLSGNHVEDADKALQQAEALLDGSDERWVAADIFRIRGLLKAAQGDDDVAADAHLAAALSIARDQTARSLGLRAATDRARLLQRRGEYQEARRLLAPLYEWFAEGFDTPDLRDANALLDELA